MQNQVAFIRNDTIYIPQRQRIWRIYDDFDGIYWGGLCPVQDPYGYIWLGDKSGLHRYDGKEFISYTTKDGLIDNNILSICEDDKWKIWIGTPVGVSCFDGQKFVNFTVKDGLTHNRINIIYKDRKSRLWFGSSKGVSYFNNNQRFSRFTPVDSLADHGIQAICEDYENRIWFGTSKNGVFCFDAESFKNYNLDNSLLQNNIVVIYADKQGRIWFGTSDGVICLDGECFINFTTRDGLAGNMVNGICEDHRGDIWFATQGGVSCYDGKGFKNYDTRHGLPDNRVEGIMQDREKLLWLSHPFSGLVCFDPFTLKVLTSEPVTEAIVQDINGNLWFSNENKLCCLSNGQLRTRNFDGVIYSLLIDLNGGFWMGTTDGLYYFETADYIWNNIARKFGKNDGLGSNIILSLIQTRDGRIWAGTANPGNLCYFYEDAFISISSPQPSILGLFEDSYSNIWFCGGTKGKGVSCYNRRIFVTYTIDNGIPSNHIYSIVEDNKGKMWFGTDKGLCSYDGEKFVTYGKDEGLISLNHRCSAKDPSGHIWFGTIRGGLYRMNDNHFQSLNIEDGLISNSITGLLPQTDNSIIIGTYRGIVVYTPTALTSPTVEIQEVIADQIYKFPKELSLTTKDADLITISYRGISFATKRLRYSYIMEGFDKEWKDTWDTQVRYENLPVGKYTFKVLAINKDLICSEKPSELNITVIPDQWIQLRAEYESEIRRMKKLLELNRRVNSQKNLSETARTIVEGLIELGFDRAGVWIRDMDKNILHGLWGTDENGNVYKNENEYHPLDGIPSDCGYDVEIEGTIIKEKLGINESKIYLKNNKDEKVFESIWGYLPPCPGYYRRTRQGDNICLCVATDKEKIGVVAVDNFITGRKIDETSANLLSLFGTEIAKVLANVALRESLAKYVDNLSFLSKATMGLVEMAPEADIYKFIGEKLGEISNCPVVILLTYNQKLGGFQISSATGIESYMDSIVKITGKNLNDVIFPKNQELTNEFKKGKLFKICDNIFELSNGNIPQDSCQNLKNIMNIDDVFAIGIGTNENIFGIGVICVPEGKELENQSIIETFIGQASIAIEHRLAEEKIRDSLAVKEVLLKEIHHRVKNNLQIISSLLNLQSGYIKDKDTLLIFKESQSRVRSMALIHEKLYQSKDLATINFSEYIEDLVRYLFHTHAAKSLNINSRISVDNISLDIDTAIPCGLIINELVINSLKHAFPFDKWSNRQEGKNAWIDIELHSIEDKKLVLIVKDNGVGFPADLDLQKTKSLGLRLVNTLTDQIGGNIDLKRENGTTFRIEFPEPKLRKKEL